MEATWSSVNADVASLLGCMPNSRRNALAVPSRALITGRTSRASATSGGASSSTDWLGLEKAMFLGTISPRVTCRKETSARATAKDTPEVTLGARPRAFSGPSRR